SGEKRLAIRDEPASDEAASKGKPALLAAPLSADVLTGFLPGRLFLTASPLAAVSPQEKKCPAICSQPNTRPTGWLPMSPTTGSLRPHRSSTATAAAPASIPRST